MSAKEDAEFQKYLSEIESALPDEAREQWRALTGKAPDVLKERFYKGTLRMDEFHRNLNATKSEKSAYEAEKAKYLKGVDDLNSLIETEAQEKAQLKAEVVNLRNELANLGLVDPTKGRDVRSADALEKQITELRSTLKSQFDTHTREIASINQAVPAILADGLGVLKRAMHDKIDIDTNALIKTAMEKGVNLQDAYSAMTAEERQKRQDAAREAELQKAREEGAREALSKLPSPDFARLSGPKPHVFSDPANISDRRKRIEAAAAGFVEAVQKGADVSI